MPVTSATIRRTTSGSERRADAGDVRQPGHRRERAAAEVEHEELRLQRRRRQRHARDDRRAAAVLLPLRGPPTTATWPAAPARLTVRVSRRCSRGRSTVPSGTTSPPSARHSRRDQAELGVLDEVGHQVVEGVGHVERRQPDLVRRRAVARPCGRRRRRAASPARPAAARRPARAPAPSAAASSVQHLGDRERQDAAQRAALVAAYPRPAGRRPGDVRRLEPQHRRLVGLEEAQAGDGRELVGVGHAEHAARLGGAERAQPDAVGQVRLQAAQPALLEPLRGEQQVQAERAAEPADGDEQVDELRLGRQHLGELVDHDEQRRQRLERLAGRAGLLVVADRGEVAGLAQQLLAAHHLAGQGVLHAVDEGELLGQVGDHRGDVRHLGHPGERRAALEVDQHHVELLGGVGHRQAEHQGAQELGLAGAGRADDQAVRAHALLGGLLDVEVDDGAAVAEADRHPQPVAGGPLPPGQRRGRRSARRRARAGP